MATKKKGPVRLRTNPAEALPPKKHTNEEGEWMDNFEERFTALSVAVGQIQTRQDEGKRAAEERQAQTMWMFKDIEVSLKELKAESKLNEARWNKIEGGRIIFTGMTLMVGGLIGWAIAWFKKG